MCQTFVDIVPKIIRMLCLHLFVIVLMYYPFVQDSI